MVGGKEREIREGEGRGERMGVDEGRMGISWYKSYFNTGLEWALYGILCDR